MFSENIFQVQADLDAARERLSALRVEIKNRGLDPSLPQLENCLTFNRSVVNHKIIYHQNLHISFHILAEMVVT